MEIINHLALGFETALTVTNIVYCFIGVLIGTAVGVLPGLGPMAAMSILFPLTYSMQDPITALIMLAGIYYGTQYGGSVTSILTNMPGELSSVVTTIDGYQMAKNGRAGPALAVAALGSLFAGCVSLILMSLIAAPVTEIAVSFGPAEYTGLMTLGLIAACSIGNNDFFKALGMVLVGILLGLVGTDITTGIERFNLGIPELVDGISFGVMAIGIFGFGEILHTIFHPTNSTFIKPDLSNLKPTRLEAVAAAKASLRGTLIGCILGAIPGGGSILSAFASYVVEKKISKNPDQFGKGKIEGVAGPESANNAGAQVSFIPMLTLGLPITPAMAILISAMMVHKVYPGPEFMSTNPTIFWGLLASMWIGNLFLIILNLPLIGIWVRLLLIPKSILYSCIVIIAVVGTYLIRNNMFDVLMLIPFGFLGYLFKRFNCETTPLAMGFVVGPLLEEFFRRTMVISGGSWNVFLDRPVALSFLILSGMLILYSLFKRR